MNKSLLKKIIIFIFMLLPALKAFAYEVGIAADNIEYDEKNGKVSAKGNVAIDWENRKVCADYVEFSIDKKIMNAYGNVKIEKSGDIIYAESVTYDYDYKIGSIKDSFACSSSLFIRAKYMEKRAEDVYAINKVKISNCDLDNPHTCFIANSGKLTLNKRITLYWPFFYIGKIPVFVLPIFTKSLKGGKSFTPDFKVVLEPGNTSDCGLFLRTRGLYSFSESSTGEIIYDYLGSRGNGYGGEFDYTVQNAKGSIYAYFIDDLIDKKEKWALRSYYWQKINSKWTMRSQVELMNDKRFNNYYNQNDREKIMNTLYSYISLTRQGQNTNLSMGASRKDNYDSESHSYNMVTAMLPHVKFTYYHKNIFWGIIHNFDVSCGNDYRKYSENKFFYKDTGIFKYNLTKAFRLGKRFTLKSSLGLSENWTDKNDNNDMDNTFISKYLGNFNSRLRITNWMDWDVKYSLTARADKNSLHINSSANDCGIETNQASFVNYMYVGDRITVRNAVSYTFKQYRRDNLDIGNRISPFITEITWTPKHYITAQANQSQFLEPFKFRDLKIYFKIGNFEKAYFKFGAFYQKYADWQMNNILGFGLWPTPKWRFDYNIRTSLLFDSL
ncbi:MAG: hypothetical protein LBQ13_01795, partial [Endomicrobium sp.]|nr:hypothetical protein [Endomicrobium sp.]